MSSRILLSPAMWIGLAAVAGLACGSGTQVPGAPGDAPGAATPDGDGSPRDAGADPLDVTWIHGSPACDTNADPPLQVVHLSADTVILRQNKCIHYEAPFLYLLFGDQRVLMQDTGATASAQSLPVRATVQTVIDEWLKQRGQAGIELIVTHSHGHGDHVAGDGQFAGQPDTTVVPATRAALEGFFGIKNWPDQIVSYDLGNRVVDIIPIPGHHPAHIAVYDRSTRILLTGDTLYPGRLYINDFAGYQASIARLVAFTESRPVSHVLGTHIEMSRTPGVDYPIGSTYQPEEHRLELSRAHLVELNAAVQAMGQTPVRETHDSFIIYPQ